MLKAAARKAICRQAARSARRSGGGVERFDRRHAVAALLAVAGERDLRRAARIGAHTSPHRLAPRAPFSGYTLGALANVAAAARRCRHQLVVVVWRSELSSVGLKRRRLQSSSPTCATRRRSYVGNSIGDAADRAE